MKAMGRYLMFISYIGTQFRAVQKQVTRLEPNKLDPDSVQGILEICSKTFNPANEPQVYVSSRTDRGVHALRSSAHVDLEHPQGKPYNTEDLILKYNRYFKKAKLNLRVQSMQLVSNDFHSRYNAKSRTYLYRLAVRKLNAPPVTKYNNYLAEIPITECNRCHIIQNPEFDVTKIEKAVKLFPGERDFRSFMNHRKDFQDKDTVRHMHRLEIHPGRPLLPYCKTNSYYVYWDIICQAKSFLYKQVRRIVGTLIAAAQGKITLDDIQYMFKHPSKESWNSRIVVVPPYALYLLDVEYDQTDILLTQERSTSDTDIIPGACITQQT